MTEQQHEHEWIVERDGYVDGQPAYVAHCECGAVTPRHWTPAEG